MRTEGPVSLRAPLDGRPHATSRARREPGAGRCRGDGGGLPRRCGGRLAPGAPALRRVSTAERRPDPGRAADRPCRVSRDSSGRGRRLAGIGLRRDGASSLPAISRLGRVLQMRVALGRFSVVFGIVAGRWFVVFWFRRRGRDLPGEQAGALQIMLAIRPADRGPGQVPSSASASCSAADQAAPASRLAASRTRQLPTPTRAAARRGSSGSRQQRYKPSASASSAPERTGFSRASRYFAAARPNVTRPGSTARGSARP